MIHSIDLVHNEMIEIEKLSDEELQQMANRFEKIRKECESRETKQDSAGVSEVAACSQAQDTTTVWSPSRCQASIYASCSCPPPRATG